jgi:hypothetical protein
MPIRTTAQVRWGFRNLELALALDNTGSMAQKNKIVELKAAVKLLLSTLKTNSKVPDDTKIAIIPFNTVVNIGTTFKDKPWVAYGSGITSATWNGCVADRDQPNDVKDTTPTAANTYYPAAMCGGSLAHALPLTSDWTALEGMVDTMTPAGTTNVTIGAMWAWSALTSNEPWTEGRPVRPDVEKVIILLTDGLNTQIRFTTVPSQIDARTAAVCDNIKAAGITLYTLQVNTGSDPTSTMLQQCATDTSKFYLVTSSSQIGTIFTQIGTNLSKLRIAK